MSPKKKKKKKKKEICPQKFRCRKSKSDDHQKESNQRFFSASPSLTTTNAPLTKCGRAPTILHANNTHRGGDDYLLTAAVNGFPTETQPWTQTAPGMRQSPPAVYLNGQCSFLLPFIGNNTQLLFKTLTFLGIYQSSFLVTNN